MVQLYRCGTTACQDGINMPSGARLAFLRLRAYQPTIWTGRLEILHEPHRKQHSCAGCWRAGHATNTRVPCNQPPPTSAAGWDDTLPPCANVTQGPSCKLSPLGPATYNGTYYTANVSSGWLAKSQRLPGCLLPGCGMTETHTPLPPASCIIGLHVPPPYLPLPAVQLLRAGGMGAGEHLLLLAVLLCLRQWQPFHYGRGPLRGQLHSG